MFITKTSLPRRTFLRGMGVSLALPLLDAMVPAATALAKTPAQGAKRFGFVYVPHGADMASWTPVNTGTNFQISPTLSVLEPFKESLVVLSNLKRAGGVAEMHAAAACGWLSGAIPKRTEAEDYRIGTTIDQTLAQKIGQNSRFPSLEFATEDFTDYVGGCTPGYSCTYMNTISWASPTTPLPMEINPRTAFERLFGDGGSLSARRAQALEDKSILDAIVAETRALQRQLASSDQARLSNYLENLREIERRIQKVEAENSTNVELVDKPLSTPEGFEDHTGLMFDLLLMAYQADLTRIFTFMMSRESSQRTFPQIGVPDPWHVVSHHGEQPEKIARNAKVNVLCLQQFAGFLEKLNKVQEGEGSLLDSSLIFYGSGMANPNVHATDPLPMIAVGGGVERGNRHVTLAKRTELGNLWLTLANRFDIPLEKYGESTGTAEFF